MPARSSSTSAPGRAGSTPVADRRPPPRPVRRDGPVGRGPGAHPERRTELLAQDRVPGPQLRQAVPQQHLDSPVGLGDRRRVVLRLDQQVLSPEERHRHLSGPVGERVRDVEICGRVEPCAHSKQRFHTPRPSSPSLRSPGGRWRRAFGGGAVREAGRSIDVGSSTQQTRPVTERIRCRTPVHGRLTPSLLVSEIGEDVAHHGLA